MRRGNRSLTWRDLTKKKYFILNISEWNGTFTRRMFFRYDLRTIKYEWLMYRIMFVLEMLIILSNEYK